MRRDQREAAADTAGCIELMLADPRDGEAFIREACAEHASCEMLGRWLVACRALADILAGTDPAAAGQVLASIRARGGWDGTADYRIDP